MSPAIRTAAPWALGLLLFATTAAMLGPRAAPVAPVPTIDEALVPSFEAIDLDASGMLTADELLTWFSADGAEADIMGVFDADGDGTVDRTEFEALVFAPEPVEV